MAILNVNNYAKIARGEGGLKAPSVPKLKKSVILDPKQFTPTKTITYTPTTPRTAEEIRYKSPVAGISNEEFTAALKKPANYAESRSIAEKQHHIKMALWAQQLQEEENRPSTGKEKTLSTISKVLKTVYTPIQSAFKAGTEFMTYGGGMAASEAAKDIGSIPRQLYDIWKDKDRGSVSEVLIDAINAAATGMSLYLYGSLVKNGINAYKFQKEIDKVGTPEWNKSAYAVDQEYLARHEAMAKDTLYRASEEYRKNPNTNVGVTADANAFDDMVNADINLKNYIESHAPKNGKFDIDYANKNLMDLIFRRNDAAGEFLRSVKLVDLTNPTVASNVGINLLAIPASPQNVGLLTTIYSNNVRPSNIQPISPSVIAQGAPAISPQMQLASPQAAIMASTKQTVNVPRVPWEMTQEEWDSVPNPLDIKPIKPENRIVYHVLLKKPPNAKTHEDAINDIIKNGIRRENTNTGIWVSLDKPVNDFGDLFVIELPEKDLHIMNGQEAIVEKRDILPSDIRAYYPSFRVYPNAEYVRLDTSKFENGDTRQDWIDVEKQYNEIAPEMEQNEKASISPINWQQVYDPEYRYSDVTGENPIYPDKAPWDMTDAEIAKTIKQHSDGLNQGYVSFLTFPRSGKQILDDYDALGTIGSERMYAYMAAERAGVQLPKKAKTDLAVMEAKIAPAETVQGQKEKRTLGQALSDIYHRAMFEEAQDQAGQAILDSIDARGDTPRHVSEVFWTQTYPALPPQLQKKFNRLVERQSGFKVGDTIGREADGTPIVARSIKDLADNLDLGDDVTALQGIERGYVAYMEMVTQTLNNIPRAEATATNVSSTSGTSSLTAQTTLQSAGNAANPPQPETSGTIDPSQFIPEPPTEKVVQSINLGMRPGFINITSIAHLANTPARTFDKLLNNDPLKIGLDKMGVYDLLYGKETNEELRAGRGNPSLWNLGFVPASVKNEMLWGELFSADTRIVFKDITVEADLERNELIKYDREVAKLSKDEFVQLLWDISRGGSGMLPVTGSKTLTKTQQLADQYITISNRARDNLIAAGLDPQIFVRLQGHYLPAPSDELGKDILPTIDEKITVKPSLGFIEKQVLPQDVIIGMASQDDTWEDYRDFMVSRMASEIRAGEKGRFFGAIAADPHTNPINPNEIDYNTGKRIELPKDYIIFSLGGERRSFALDGYAIPKWVSIFIKNQFTSREAMEQMKVVQEILGQWKWNKAIINIPTFIRNLISQLTFQSIESGLSVFNLDNYIIRPLGALLGLNKADQQELINLGILDNGIVRDLEGLGFSPQERDLWINGKDRGTKLGMVYEKFKSARGILSSVYSFADNLTKAGAYYAARENFDPKTARVLSALTTGDYSQRPPIVNLLTRGIYNGHINPFAMIFSAPFAFYKIVVEPQRVGNLLRNHPTLFVTGLLGAAVAIKELIKKIQREYGISEAEATALVNQFENYYWLNGKYVIPTGKNEGIDVTSMIPMIDYITEAKKALVTNKTLAEILATANSLVTGVNSANFILETLVSLSTGYDLNYFLQYGSLKSIGKTNTEQLLWLVQQMSPTWLNKLLFKKKGGKDFTLDDLIGQYKITLSEADKNKSWYYIKRDPTISVEDKKRIAAAFFGPESIEQIAWDRIMGSK